MRYTFPCTFDISFHINETQCLLRTFATAAPSPLAPLQPSQFFLSLHLRRSLLRDRPDYHIIVHNINSQWIYLAFSNNSSAFFSLRFLDLDLDLDPETLPPRLLNWQACWLFAFPSRALPSRRSNINGMYTTERGGNFSKNKTMYSNLLLLDNAMERWGV